MRSAFADTSYFVALLSPRDAHHGRAQVIDLVPYNGVITTDWVLAEVGNMIARDPNRKRFSAFVTSLRQSDRFHVMEANRASFDEGLALYSGRPDKKWSLIDCISIAVMTKLGITEALTADHHFTQAGFRALLLS